MRATCRQQAGPFTPAPTSPYYLSAENDLHTISQYYNLPILSLRAAVYHLMVTQQPGYRVSSLFWGVCASV